MLRSALLIAFVFRDASCCNITKLQACVVNMNSTINAISINIPNGTSPTPQQKEAQCEAVNTYELCYVNSTGCAAITTNALTQNLADTRNYLSTKYGNECRVGSVAKRPTELSSGDSGISTSGSEPKTSSGSTYGFLVWQLIFLICCILCCCAAAGGGGVYYTQTKKKNKKPKAPRADDRDFEAQRPEEVPLASAVVDVNGDGIDDFVVTGEDKNRDGIPDILQGDTSASMQVQAIVKDGETVLTAPANAGDMILQVASQAGFSPGQTISIGNPGMEEVNTIAGFGSIVLKSPLQRSHPLGAAVSANINNTPLFGMPQPLMGGYPATYAAPTTYSAYQPTTASYYQPSMSGYPTSYAAPTTYSAAPATTAYTGASYAQGASYASPAYTTGATYAAPATSYAAPATYATGYPAGGVY